VDTFAARKDLIAYWESGWGRLFEALEALTPADVAGTVAIRGEPHSVPLAIQRSLAHCGYHVGQIVLIARILKGEGWETITIPRGGSAGFNRQVWGEGIIDRDKVGEPPGHDFADLRNSSSRDHGDQGGGGEPVCPGRTSSSSGRRTGPSRSSGGSTNCRRRFR
jgi:hypothetical protein